MKELLSQISISAIELDSSFYSTTQIDNQWIGYSPCLDSELKDAESRLGITLPEDYKQFMLFTNGFSFANGVDPSFSSINEIDLLINNDPELIEIWVGSGNDEVGNKMKKAIIVGGINEEQHFFLVPIEEGKWEYWVFAAWIPGEEVYTSLREYFDNVLQTTRQFIESK